MYVIFHNITIIYSTFWSGLVSIRHFFQKQKILQTPNSTYTNYQPLSILFKVKLACTDAW